MSSPLYQYVLDCERVCEVATCHIKLNVSTVIKTTTGQQQPLDKRQEDLIVKQPPLMDRLLY